VQVVDREAGPLVEHDEADPLAETRREVDARPAQRHHGAVLAIQRRLVLATTLARERGHQQATLLVPVEGAVLGHRDHRVEVRGQQPGHRGVDRRGVAERRRRLQHDHHVAALALGLQLVDRVHDHRLQAGQVGGQLGRAQERHVGAALARDLGHPRVVGGDHDPVHGRRGPRGVQRVGQQRPVAEALEVQVRHAVGAAAGRDEGDDPGHTIDHVSVVSSAMSTRATRPTTRSMCLGLMPVPGRL
jgi:hypothetical protein